VIILRTAAAAAVLAGALFAIRVLSIKPYRSNILKKRVEQQFAGLQVALAGHAPSFNALAVTRQNLAAIRDALRYVPTDVDLHLELAAYYGLQQQLDRQIDTYLQLLEYHRRPEIYLNLGMAEFAARRHDRAIDHLGHSLAFDYLYIHQVPEALKEDVARRAERLRVDIAAKLAAR
jgi:tetratricopeptide (TPR) repeat protein